MDQPVETGITSILRKLNSHGWVSLRSMSALLGYSHPTGIYRRQVGKNPIATILVGSTYRVYEDVVIETLENAPEEDQLASQTILRLYRQIQKQEPQDE